jgi:branched-subunit amino acid transport protein AzlD
VYVIANLYYYTDWSLSFGLLALQLWAIIDCATRRMAAFPAVDKLTKPAWMAMLILGTLFSVLTLPSPLGIFSLVSAVITAVYLADVRPAVREISGGTSR